jgi:hypothetical protein
MRPSVDRYVVEAALAFARTCATTLGMPAECVPARFADAIHSTNSRRCVNEKAAKPDRSFAASRTSLLKETVVRRVPP